MLVVLCVSVGNVHVHLGIDGCLFFVDFYLFIVIDSCVYGLYGISLKPNFYHHLDFMFFIYKVHSGNVTAVFYIIISDESFFKDFGLNYNDILFVVHHYNDSYRCSGSVNSLFFNNISNEELFRYFNQSIEIYSLVMKVFCRSYLSSTDGYYSFIPVGNWVNRWFEYGIYIYLYHGSRGIHIYWDVYLVVLDLFANLSVNFDWVRCSNFVNFNVLDRRL